MPILSNVTLLVEPPPPKRETVTLDMSNVRYAVVFGPRNVVWAVFGLRAHAVSYRERNPEQAGSRIIDLTNGNDVTIADR